MNKYDALRAKQQKEIDAFPCMWAFNQRQFAEGMAQLGLKETDTDKIYSLGNGGFIRKTDSEALAKMLNNHAEEMEKAIAEDKTGDGFIYDMFNYELANHEYSYTGDITDTLACLGLTLEKVNADERLLHGLKKR
jgi:hypothetical protein